MKVIELFSKALEHESMWQLIDHLTVERLKETLDSLVEERDKQLEEYAGCELALHMGNSLKEQQALIAALNRVITFYGARV